MRMADPVRRCAALVLVLGLTLPAPAAAQEAEAPPAADGSGVGGSWAGWAKLVNDWPGDRCRYEGGPAADSVHLELSPSGAGLKGSVAIDLPAEPGSTCPPLRKRYSIDEASVGEGTVAFTDSGGNEWNLSLRRSGTVLQGLLAWRSGGADQPLAEGFSTPDGQRPATRLSGEVRLTRGPQGAPAEGAAAGGGEPAAAAAPAAKAGVGRHLGNLGIVLGANVVGLGLLYGVNKVGKGSSSTGVVTCSPRVCIVGAPNAPCFCEGNVVSGGDCGTTEAGAPIGAPCDGKTVPCESGLSCNSGTCEDRSGHCQY